MDIEKLRAQRARFQQFKVNPFKDYWTLRENKTGRLVFLAETVSNTGNPEASIHGTLFYEKKSANSRWEAVESVPLSRLRADEGVKLDLHAEEVLNLYRHLHGKLGKASPLQALLESLDDLSAEEEKAMGELILWALKNPQGPSGLVSKLKKLPASALGNLHAAVQLASLEELYAEMSADSSQKNERYWQKLLGRHSVLLQQLFEFPITIAEESAYVGGKRLDNRGGQLVDFLMKNKLTNSVSLVEIKTPQAALLQSAPYRDNVFGCSSELGGAVAQVLSYKESLLKHFFSLSQSDPSYEAFDPRCIVIMGQTRELNTTTKRRCFELFRAQLPSVKIVTFDELHEQLSSLIALLKGESAE